MKKITRKTPQSVKTQRKVDIAIDQVAAEKDRYYKQIIANQQGRHNAEIERLKIESPQPLFEKEGLNHGLVVPDWKQGWKWFSNLALAAIVAINTSPIPPEILDAMSPDLRQQVTIGLAVVGILGRFINQSRRKEDADV